MITKPPFLYRVMGMLFLMHCYLIAFRLLDYLSWLDLRLLLLSDFSNRIIPASAWKSLPFNVMTIDHWSRSYIMIDMSFRHGYTDRLPFLLDDIYLTLQHVRIDLDSLMSSFYAILMSILPLRPSWQQVQVAFLLCFLWSKSWSTSSSSVSPSLPPSALVAYHVAWRRACAIVVAANPCPASFKGWAANCRTKRSSVYGELEGV